MGYTGKKKKLGLVNVAIAKNFSWRRVEESKFGSPVQSQHRDGCLIMVCSGQVVENTILICYNYLRRHGK